jgi:catechol-2,3-dioxygenase
MLLNMTHLPHLTLRHLGMFVRDIERMSGFYKEVLGFTQTDSGHVRGHDVVFLTRDEKSHHQLVMETGRSEHTGPGFGLQQISFQVSALEDLRVMHALVKARSDVGLIQTIDHGNAWSLYFRDPEDNRVEIYLDSPWYIPQPYGEVFNLDSTDAEIHACTFQKVQAIAGYQTMGHWQEQLAQQIKP